jgi:hypothetical protein
LGLLCALLALGLLRALLLCWLRVLLSLFLVVLCVSRYDQSRKQAQCHSACSTRESHVINSYRGVIQARRVPSGYSILNRLMSNVVHAVH